MVALIFCGDLKYCPYMKRYLERIEKKNIDYRVYFWSRDGCEQNISVNYIYYDSYSELNKSKVEKVFDFAGFRKWLIGQLKKNRPDKLFLLSTLTGVLLYDIVRKLQIEYFFDIRDYSYEFVPLFKMIETKVINNSSYTVISSRGFKSFLPEYDYIIAHNFNRKDMSNRYSFAKSDEPIRIVWNGVMRYFDFQKKYIDALKNDSRFLMVYHGDGPEYEQYLKYCEGQNVKNIVFTGSYDNNDKEKLLLNAHILNNCYGFAGKESKVKYAVSNRFYDGVIYHIPQIVEPNGYKTTWVTTSRLGVNYPIDEFFADRLYKYYQSIDKKTFDIACDETLKVVIEEDNKYIEAIDSFLGR